MRKDEMIDTIDEQMKSTEQTVFHVHSNKSNVDTDANSSICKQINNFLAKQTNELYQRNYLAEMIAGMPDSLKSLGYGSLFSVHDGQMEYSTHYAIAKDVCVETVVSLDENNNVHKTAVKVWESNEIPRSSDIDFDEALTKLGQDKNRYDAFVKYLQDVNSKYNLIMSDKHKNRK